MRRRPGRSRAPSNGTMRRQRGRRLVAVCSALALASCAFMQPHRIGSGAAVADIVGAALMTGCAVALPARQDPGRVEARGLAATNEHRCRCGRSDPAIEGRAATKRQPRASPVSRGPRSPWATPSAVARCQAHLRNPVPGRRSPARRAQVDHARAGRRHPLSLYTSLPWATLCEELAKLKIERLEGRVIELPRVAQVGEIPWDRVTVGVTVASKSLQRAGIVGLTKAGCTGLEYASHCKANHAEAHAFSPICLAAQRESLGSSFPR